MADTAPSLARPSLDVPPGTAATLVLVRHGESTWVAEGRFQGRQDPPLSELGQRQARLVAERLARRNAGTPLPIPVGRPAAVWHSPLQRAAHTARIIADEQGRTGASIATRPEPGLTEIAQGEWEGLPQTEVRSRYAAELDAWRRTPVRSNAPGGERLVDAERRVRLAIAGMIQSLLAEAGVIASPSDAAGGRVAASYDPVPGYPSAVTDSDAPPEPWGIVVAHDGIFRLVLISLLGVPLERFWSFPFNLAAITVVALHEGVAALRAHNLSDHLEPLADEERAAQESRGERRGAL